MEKFTKLYKRFAEEGLSPNEQVALAYMYDRMDLSEGNSNFYDNQHNGYYITYSRSELAKQLNVSVATVTSIFNKLVKKGWLIIKRRFNSTNRIFLPKCLKSKNCTSKIKNLDSNYTDPSQTDRTSHNNHDTKKEVNDLKMDGIEHSLINKSGFSPRLASSLKALSFNDPNKLYEYGKLILKAKRTALRYSVPKNSNLRKFETNPLLNDKLEKSIEPIIRNAHHSVKNKYGYMLKSCRNLIEEAIDEYSQSITLNKQIDTLLPENLAY